MNYPKISIVTPSYNQGQFLEQTILSVLDQNYPNLEFIIIDGGSKDNSIDILKKYSRHLAFWISEPDKGQSDAINKGITKCTGEIFNWLNSDDFLEPGSLEQINKSFGSGDTHMVYGKCRKFNESGTSRIIPEFFENKSLEESIVSPGVMQPSVFMRVSAIRKMGMLHPGLHYCMDLEWILRHILLFGTSGIVKTDSILSNARLHAQSKTSSDITVFRNEAMTIWFHLARQLGAPGALQEKIQKTKMVRDDISLTWQIGIHPETSVLFRMIEAMADKYLGEPSYIYREAADYYAYYGLKKETMKACVSAWRADPFRILNYKYIIRQLLK